MDLSGLNKRQREAVEHRGSPLLVLAGAGSGKTRVITYRIGHLLATRDAKPSQILAVTFTNRAASEMKERVQQLVGKKAGDELLVATFHSFCATLLRTEIAHFGYSKNYTIYDSSDQRTLLSRCLEEFSTHGEAYDVGTFAYRISRAKNKGLTPDTWEPANPLEPDKYDELLVELWKKYQTGLKARDAVDFDDLLLLVLQLFKDHPRVLEKYRQRFQHILIDEYQDTNSVQFQIAYHLAEKHRNLCAVGDDDQSIYGWRGAEVSNILEFEKAFNDARIIPLEQNYRSTENILSLANSVIGKLSSRRDKKLWSQLGAGDRIEVVQCLDEENEAEYVADRIDEIIRQDDLNWSDIAILYRSNIQSRPFVTELRKRKFPYVVIGGMDFFDRKEVKDIAAYLRVLHNPRDDVSLRRILNVPRRGIGDTTLERLNQESIHTGKPLTDTLKHSSRLDIPDSARQGIQSFLSLLERTQQEIRENSLSRGIHYLIQHSGYLEELERNSPNSASFLRSKEYVLDMVNAAASHEQSVKNPGLQSFLQDASLLDDFRQDGSKKGYEADAIRVMTLHSAKGLEFPVVFLVGVENGLLPHARSMGEGSETDEERRLFYVGITRARRKLILTNVLERTIRGRRVQVNESPFLQEVPEELYSYHFTGAKARILAR